MKLFYFFLFIDTVFIFFAGFLLVEFFFHWILVYKNAPEKFTKYLLTDNKCNFDKKSFELLSRTAAIIVSSILIMKFYIECWTKIEFN